MKNIHLLAASFFSILLLAGCSKNLTDYYPDAEDPGLAIFSNSGNNLMTCYTKGKPWKTDDRFFSAIAGSGGGYHIRYEVYIFKQQSTTGNKDTLDISWTGTYVNDSVTIRNIGIKIPVAPDFSYRNFTALRGQRISVDGTNGYFYTNGFSLPTGDIRGKGSIFFLTAQADSLPTQRYTGKLSGIFEADFTGYTITRGRFDHTLDEGNLNFF